MQFHSKRDNGSLALAIPQYSNADTKVLWWQYFHMIHMFYQLSKSLNDLTLSDLAEEAVLETRKSIWISR